MIEVETRFADRSQFAEVAEVLGIPTDRIIGALAPKGNKSLLGVLYCPDPAPDPVPEDPKEWGRVCRVGMVRGPDRMLVLHGEPEELPGFWEDFDRMMKEDE